MQYIRLPHKMQPSDESKGYELEYVCKGIPEEMYKEEERLAALRCESSFVVALSDTRPLGRLPCGCRWGRRLLLEALWIQTGADCAHEQDTFKCRCGEECRITLSE